MGTDFQSTHIIFFVVQDQVSEGQQKGQIQVKATTNFEINFNFTHIRFFDREGSM